MNNRITFEQAIEAVNRVYADRDFAGTTKRELVVKVDKVAGAYSEQAFAGKLNSVVVAVKRLIEKER